MKKIFAVFALCLCAGVPSSQDTASRDKPDAPPTLDALLKQLDHKDVEVRVQAMMELAAFGPKAAPALKRLLAALAEKDEDLRLNAALALGKIGKEAVTPLAGLLKSADEEVRFYAVWAIGGIGSDASGAVPQVIRMLGDKSDAVRRKAAYALGRIGGDADTVIDELANVLHDRDEDVRAAAAEALVKHGAKAVPSLIDVLGSCKPGTAQVVVQALSEIGSDAKDAVPALRQMLLAKAQPSEDATWIASGLAKIGKHATQALADGVKDERVHVRQASLQALSEMQGEGVPILVDGLADKHVDVRRTAARLLGPLNVSDKMVVLGLAFALKDDDDQVRIRASESLQNLGAGAKEAVPHLLRALPDSHAHVRGNVLNALQGLGVDVYAELGKHFKSADAATRLYAACALVIASVDRPAALPVVRQAVKGKDPARRVRAAHALAMIGQDIPTILPVLTEALKDDGPGAREHALEGLQALGMQAATAAPAILDVLRIPNHDLREQALNTLQTVRGKPADVIPGLAKYLREPSDFRLSIVNMIWQYGAPAVPPLLDAMSDKDETFRQHAQWSLQRISGDLRAVLPDLVKHARKGATPESRQVAVQLMANAQEAAVPALLDLLKEKDEPLRVAAIGSLQALGPKAAKAVPALLTVALKDTPECARAAAYALVNQGDDGVKALRKAIADTKNRELYLRTVEAAGSYGRGAKEVVALLVEALRDSSAELRAQAAAGLGNHQAVEAIPDLKRALKDKDNNVAYQAGWALGRMGPAGQVELVAVIKHDAALRPAALYGLANHNFKDAKAVPLFIECLKDEREEARWRAAQLLGNLGPEAKDAAPALVGGLADKDANVRAHVHNALAALADLAHPALLDGLKKDDSALRTEILQRLAQQMPPVEKSVPAVMLALKDRAPAVRAQAAGLLGGLGSAARAAVPALRNLLNDRDAGVRQNAQAALTQIQGKMP